MSNNNNNNDIEQHHNNTFNEQPNIPRFVENICNITSFLHCKDSTEDTLKCLNTYQNGCITGHLITKDYINNKKKE